MNANEQLLQRLFNLVDLADPARSPNDNEARNAAMKACEILRAHRDRIELVGGPGKGQVHPLAALFHRHGVQPQKATTSCWCLSCGEAIAAGTPTAAHDQAGSTHYACREWWRDFDFDSLPDEIPF